MPSARSPVRTPLATATLLVACWLVAVTAEDVEPFIERSWQLALGKLDKNKDRRLQIDELKNAKDKGIERGEVDVHADYVAMADTDRDGVVNRREFFELQRNVWRTRGRDKDEP